MRFWYIDCLVVIFREVGTSPFTLAEVRPTLEPLYSVNGSVLKEICQAGFLEVVRGGDVRAHGSKYIHRYRVTSRGQQALMRRGLTAPMAVVA